MTAQELDDIEERARAAAPKLSFTEPFSVQESAEDVPALIAEVRRLREKGWNNCEDCINDRLCYCRRDD